MNWKRMERWGVPIVFLGAVTATLVFRALAPGEIRDSQGSDYTLYYHPTANSLIAGRGYLTPTGLVQTGVPPGYPLLLAAALQLAHAVGAGDVVGVWFLMTLSVGFGAIAIYLMARMLGGVKTALVSSVLWMTCPFTQTLTLQLGSEVPFMPVFYASAGFFIRGILMGASSLVPFFLTGLLTGVAMLIRPIAIGLGGLYAVLLLFFSSGRPHRRRATLVAALLLGNAVMVLPWEGWLYLKTGRIIVLSDAGSSTLRAGWTFAVHPDGAEGRPMFGEDISNLMREFATAEKSGSSETILRILIREAPQHPRAVARLIFLKLTRCWYGTESMRFERAILLAQAVYLPLLLLAGWGVWRTSSVGRIAVLTIGFLILYFWGMAFLFIPLLRFMTPAQGLAFVLLPGPLRWGALCKPHPLEVADQGVSTGRG